MAFDWSKVSLLFQLINDLNRWKLHSNGDNDKFCPFCEATKETQDDFDQWSKQLQFATTMFGDITIVPCILHAKIRVTEKLMKLALSKATERSCEEQFYEAMSKVCTMISIID